MVRMGGEQSEKQWRDVLGILWVTGSAIDRETLLAAARDFEVGALCLEGRLGGMTDPPTRPASARRDPP
jgi:hypothetical protein